MKYKRKYNIRADQGIFRIVLESDNKERGYTVRVPKFPEIITEGKTIQEAKKMAREAIELCVECIEDEHHTHTKSKRYSPNSTSSRI